jgi:hypothetical protein
MVFMDNIVNEAVEILKQETSNISREKALMIFLFGVIREIMACAFEKLDDELVESYRAQGYEIEKKNNRTILTLLGTITFRRRRYIKAGVPSVYALDKWLGLKKHVRYSLLVQRNICELATKMTYRNAETAISLLTDFTMCHRKINRLVTKIGKDLKQKQQSETRYDEAAPKREVPFLYVEGDGIEIKGQGKNKLTIHRFQICEGKKKVGKKRNKLINYHAVSSMNRLTAEKEIIEYIESTYHLKNTVILSNSDGGSGYEKSVFDEFAFSALRHEHFRDQYHVNRKIKERLNFSKELQWEMIQAVQSFDWERVETILDTAESVVVLSEDVGKNAEQLRLLEAYLVRNWEYLKPVGLRELGTGVQNCIGTCESNHRAYTYRMKRQGRHWTYRGAESMIRIIDSLRNGDFDYWLETDSVPYITDKEMEKKIRAAVRFNTTKRMVKFTPHIGAIQGRVVINHRHYYKRSPF